MVTPCINNIQHFNFQLMHTTLKDIELLKHFKILKHSNQEESAPEGDPGCVGKVE